MLDTYQLDWSVDQVHTNPAAFATGRILAFALSELPSLKYRVSQTYVELMPYMLMANRLYER